MVKQSHSEPASAALPGVSRRRMLSALFGDRLALFREAAALGDVVALGGRRRPVVQVNNPEGAYTVLVERSESFEKGPGLRQVTRPLLGNGLLTSDNSFHHPQRKLVASAFAPRRLAGYVDVMAEFTADHVRQWRDGQVVDIHAEMSRLTLAIAARTLFGASVEEEAGEIARAVTQTARHAARAIRSMLPIPLEWPLPENIRTRRSIERLDHTVYRMIADRRRSGTDDSGDDFLSILLRARAEGASFTGGKISNGGMTDTQVRDEVMTLFLAGHETTANALSWALRLLAIYPEAFGRLRAEARRELNGGLPDYESLVRIPYSLQVFKEAIRIFPPAYAISRETVEVVAVCGVPLPAGTIVLISPYTLHRRSDIFPHPESFRPERFTPEAERKLPRCAYIPFSAGPRNCIGSLFALAEGQTVLSILAQEVWLELLPDQEIVPEPLITLRPKNGILMRVHRGKHPPAQRPFADTTKAPQSNTA